MVTTPKKAIFNHFLKTKNNFKQKNARLVIFVIYTSPDLPKFEIIKTSMNELVLKLKDEIQSTQNPKP